MRWHDHTHQHDRALEATLSSQPVRGFFVHVPSGVDAAARAGEGLTPATPAATTAATSGPPTVVVATRPRLGVESSTSGGPPRSTRPAQPSEMS